MTDTPYARIVEQRFAGQANFVRLTGYPQSRVAMWKASGGEIHTRHWDHIDAVAKANGIRLQPSDFHGVFRRSRKTSAA